MDTHTEYNYSPLKLDSHSDTKDSKLVSQAVGGDRDALEELLRRHQDWIYNIALRMVGQPMDAEDVTQEVLLKVITKLSTFKQKSSFRTWLYRIVANHVINLKKRKADKYEISFDQYWNEINQTPDRDFHVTDTLPVDIVILMDEIKIKCMMGLLLCLDRRKRLVFILGEIFQVDHNFGAEVMEISKDNFRQLLSRARKLVYGFLNDKCGHIHRGNPCLCINKAAAMIESDEINPADIKFSNSFLQKIRTKSVSVYDHLKKIGNDQNERMFRDQPFYKSREFACEVRELLRRSTVQSLSRMKKL